MTLAERYRPATLQDVVGQDKAVRTLRRVLKNGAGGRAVYISGGSGTGKTTIGRILAKSIASEWFGVTEVPATELTTARMRDITRAWQFEGGHALIVNESHLLTRPVIVALLDIIENLQDNVCLVFTTTREGRDLFENTKHDAGPFASRCLCITLNNRGLALANAKTKEPGAFARHAYEIATKEGLNGRPIADYVTLIQKCKNNLRQALTEIEAGAMLES